MKKKLILSADIGKYETKLLGRFVDGNKDDLQRVSLKTKMYDLANGSQEIEGNSYKIEFDGKEYIVGDQGEEKSNDTSKTELLHKLTCYSAITEFMSPGDESDVYMVLACPLSVLKIEDAKEEYKNFIKGEGPVKLKVNDEEYTFTIKEIMLKAEGSGIVFLEPKLFIDKTVAVIDLGGLNMGFSLYNNKTCKISDRFIEEAGTDMLIDMTRDQLSLYKNGNLVDKDIAEKALNEGCMKKAGKIDVESVKYITNAKESYFNKVMNNVKEHKYEIDALDEVVFVGGTTQHIKEIISREIDHAYIPHNSQWSTVEGLYKVAYNKYGK